MSKNFFHCLSLAALLAAVSPAYGAAVAIPSPITSSTTVILGLGDTISSSSIKVENGAVLTVTRSGTAGTTAVFPSTSLATTATLTLDGSAGRIKFIDIRDNTTGSQAGLIKIDGGATALQVLNVKGVDFIRISAGSLGSGVGGVFMFNKNGVVSTFSDVLFEDNYQLGIGGVARVNAGLASFTDAVFKGNYSVRNYGGAFDVRGTGTLALNRAVFENNRAFQNGGAIGSNSGTPGVFDFTDVVFKNNWTVQNGGALQHGITAKMTIHMTLAGGTNNYVYSGNIASGSAPAVSTEWDDRIINNNPYTPAARAGGFYYGAGGMLDLNIDGGVTLTIGEAAQANKNIDSIANNNTSGTLAKTGSGTLVLNADNSYWRGIVRVDAGSLLLGNSAASLGGIITVASGATFGGSGTLAKRTQADAFEAMTITAQAGSTLQVGRPGAATPETLTFVRTGSNRLTLSGSVTLNFDLFGSNGADGTYSQLITDQLVANTGTNIIAITNLGTADSYKLISSSSLTGAADNFSYRLIGIAPSARNSLTFSVLNHELFLNNSLASLALKWTGSDGASWANSAITNASWTDNGTTPETHFNDGDAVSFDSAVDIAHASNRNIAIATEGVTVSGLSVGGTGNYSFNGGAITVSATSARAGFTGTTGKLEKSGAGTLTLSNTANTFGDIELSGGALVFASAAQLGAGADNIRFTGDAALRAAPGAGAVAITNQINIDPAVAGTLDTNGQTITHAGALAGTGTLTKSGAGTLRLTADNSASTLSILASQGSFLLDGATAKFGGGITAGAGATIGGTGEYTGNVSLLAGSLLQVGADSARSQLTVNNLDINGGKIAFDLFDGNLADQLVVANLTSLSGSFGVDVSAFRLGAHTLATIAAGDRAALAANAVVTVGGRIQAGPRQIMKLSVSGNDIIVTGSADSSRAMRWTGGGVSGTMWDDANANWTDGAAVNTFAEGDRVTFTASSGTTHTIGIAGTRITVSDMIVDGAASYTFNGAAITTDKNSVIGSVISGAQGKLTKDGAGRLTLANTGVNDFKGGIELKAGTLALAAAGASGTGAINVTGTATLQMAAADLALANTLDIGAAGALVLDTQANNAAFDGRLSGGGILNKTGSGTLALNTASVFTGTTVLSEGALALGHAAALGAAPAKLVVGGGIFSGSSGHETAAAVRVTLLNNGLAVANGIDLGAAASTLTLDTSAHSGTLAGNIAGAGNLSKAGAGSLALSGSNTFSGTLAINEGRVVLKSANALGAARLAGTGTLTIATPGVFAFASTASGGGYSGLVALESGKLSLDANAAAVLSTPGAVLRLDAGGAAQKVSGDVSIRRLALNGGLMSFGMTLGGSPDGILIVDTLDLGTGVSKIGVDTSALLAQQTNPAVPPNPNILDLDNGVDGACLIAAANVTGAGTIELTDITGAPIPVPAYAGIVQGTGTVAKAGYNYRANIVDTGTSAGVYMGYGLTDIEVFNGRQLILNNTHSTDSTLSAKITGSGGLDIQAGGTSAIVLTHAGNDYTGMTTVSSGTLRTGAIGILAASAGVEVKSGATLDLAGNAQTVRNICGNGLITLGAAALTVSNTADNTFAGSIAGTGRLVKNGAGRLTLSGSSSHTGGVEYRAGSLGIGASNALGSGTLTVAVNERTLWIDAAGLRIPNAINIGANDLAIMAAAGNNSTLAGSIAGNGALTVRGEGVTTLSGTNSAFSGGLNIEAPRVVAGHARALGAGSIAIGAASTLEFRDIPSGSVDNLIYGNALEFNNSTLSLGGANTLQKFVVNAGSKVTASSAGALGGSSVAVTINNGGELGIGKLNTPAGGLIVRNGGRLVFNPMWKGGLADPMLAVPSATLENGATIAIGTFISGDYLLLKADSLTAGQTIHFDPGPNAPFGLNTDYFKVDPEAGTVSFAAMNYTANPGKDIAAILDAMSATNGAVYSRISETFLMSLDRVSRPARASGWLKLIGSYADNDGNSRKTGYTSDTYGAVVGYDRALGENLLLGLYAGCLSNRITSDNNSENKGTQPFVGLFGAAQFEKFYLAADFVFGSMDADTSRFEQEGCAVGKYSATTFGGSIEAGAVLAAWKYGRIKPSVALHYMRVSYSHQEETGPGAVSIADLDANALEGFAGMQVTQNITMPWKRPGMFDAVFGYRATLSESSLKINGRFLSTGGQSFTTGVDNYNRNGLMIGFGLRFAMTENSAVSFGYDFELGSEFQRHTGTATVRFNW